MGYHWNHLDDLMVWLKIITRLVRLTKQGATCWGLRQLGFLAVGCVELLETSGRWRCSFVPGSSCTSHSAGWMPSGVATNSIFFWFLFVKKSLICLEGKSMTTRWGKYCSLSFLPATPSSPSRLGPLKGFLSWHGALQGPSTRLVCCFRNYRDTRTLSGVPC